MSDHADIVRDFAEACCGDDIRINGCVCSSGSKCYIHGVLAPKALAALDALVAERDALQAFKDEALQTDWIARAEAAEAENARLQHFIDCADTPLMRDVLAERDRLKARLRELGEEL
jgi:hypothetical protein